MQIRNIIKPNRLLLAFFVLQFGSYFLYAMGILKSYRISFVSTNIFGFVCLLLYYFLQLIIFMFAEKVEMQKRSLQCVNTKKIKKISLVYLSIAFVGFLGLTVNLIRQYSIGKLFYMILRNRQVDELVYGNGNTILCDFAIASLMLLSLIVDIRDKKMCILWITNFLFLVVYAGFLSSRILILQGALFSIIIFARRFWYDKKIGNKFILLVIVAACFFIITSGYRDYDQAGHQYTNSKLNWGISRCTDYLISTFNTSTEIDTWTTGKPSSFPTNTIELLSKITNFNNAHDGSSYSWRKKVSAVEYTNIGAFAQIYSDWRLAFLIPVLIISLISIKVWILYDGGILWGYMLWPLMLYNILETWRINYLGTAMAEILFMICCITCVLCKKCFVEK